MRVEIVTTPWEQVAADWLIVGLSEPIELAGAAAQLDVASGGRLSYLKQTGDLTGKLAETLPLRDARPLSAKRLLFVGLGKPAELTRARLEKAIATAVRQVTDKKNLTLAIAVPANPLGTSSLSSGPPLPLSAGEMIETIAVAAGVAGVGQALHQSEPSRFPAEQLLLLVEPQSAGPDAESAARKGQILAEAINVVRELVNQSPGDLYPESFAQRAAELSLDFGVSCGIFDEERLAEEQMASMLAVGQGSSRPPRMVVLKYDGTENGSPQLALVGKGVTFDSGGLSIKPTEGMLTMKCDMAGAATVLGTVLAAARLKLPVHLTGYLGLVENMISGNSYKLGDVLTARNGTTIEVNNTDAEGRLVLADVLSYVVDAGADRIIDLATLTGACVVALGEEVVGVFTNDQPWCDELVAAARRAGEDVWQLPMFDPFGEMIKSEVADIKNSAGRWGGAITAAKFLERFVDKKPWIHLDIAGPAFAPTAKPHRDGGGTGCMVRTLVELASHLGRSPCSP